LIHRLAKILAIRADVEIVVLDGPVIAVILAGQVFMAGPE
jgi:hypothetical protein